MERKEAIEVVKKNWPDSRFTWLREALETLIPEFQESEDERIRKQLLKHLREVASGKSLELSTTDYERWATWVEKQGEKGINGKNREIPFSEQNPAWSEEDERIRQNIEKLIRFASPAAHTTKEEALDWLKSLKDRVLQKPAEWSEENEKMFEHIIAKATLHFSSINYLDEEEINFLKSLRPQPHWKPSDKQMKAIEHICDGNYNVDLDILDSIYRDFKKLRK